MNIHEPTFSAFIALGLSPAGLDEAERLILSSSQDPQQADLIKWLFHRIRGLRQEDKPNVVLSPADEIYLEGLLSMIDYTLSDQDIVSPRRNHSLSSKLDFLYFARDDRIWSPLKLLNFFYRSNFTPTKRAAVVVSVRNEAVNILEWIAHHRAFGFEEFFFYVNDSDDGTFELLKALARSGVCHTIVNETNLGRHGADHFRIQSKALEHAIHCLTPLRDFEWVFFPDVDEFLVTQAIASDSIFDRPLDDLIQRLHEQAEKPSGVLFNWCWFGSNSAYSREEGLNFERFCNCVDAGHVKTFARLSRCLAFPTSHLPHFPYGDCILDGALKPVTNRGHEMPVVYDYGQINHYWNRSFEEFVTKYLRSWAHRSFQDFFTYGNNQAFGRFERLPDGWIDRVKEEITLLRSLPEVESRRSEAEIRFREFLERYNAEHNLPALYVSERFGSVSKNKRRADSETTTNAGIFRHVVAPPQSWTQRPLLPGTERFAAPWLRYWHGRLNQAFDEEVVCYSVMGAIVSKCGVIWQDNKPFDPLDLRPRGNVANFGEPNGTLPLRTVESPCMVMTGLYGDSYGDRIGDWMLRIGIVYHAAVSLHLRFRILVDSIAPNWVRQLIRLVWGLGPDAIEIYDPEKERVFLRHALVSTDSLGMTNLHPFLNTLIDEIASYSRPRSSIPRISRVFLTQTSSSRHPKRQCLNEAELIELAVGRHDFKSVAIENLSWLDQIRLFSQADVVVNNSSLDLQTAIFCPPESRFADLGFRTLLTSEAGTMRKFWNSYFMIGTESKSRYRIERELFGEFLDILCGGPVKDAG